MKFIITCIIFFSCLLPVSTIANQGIFKSNVLIIHSYHKDMQWVDQVHQGIERELLTAMGNSIDIKVEYMDSKRYINESYHTMLAALWRYKYKNNRPDCLIVCDDNALNLVLSLREDIFKGIPIVFCGINHYDPKRFAAVENLTGVVEAYDLNGTLHIIKQLLPEKRRIFIINDSSTSGRANKRRLETISYDFAGHFSFMYSGHLSIYELQSVVRKLSEDTVILLMTFNRDSENNILRYRDAIHAFHGVSTNPIFSVWSFYLGKGIVGGSLVNGRSQGQKAAELCLKILEGEKASELPIIQTSPNLPMFDYKELKRFSLSDSNLPKGSIIINTPNTLWHRYKQTLLFATGILVIQFCFIALLIHNIRKRKTSEKKLLKNQQNLAITLEAIGEGVISVNSTFHIARANPSAAKILETPLEELNGVHLPDLLLRLDAFTGNQIAKIIQDCYTSGNTISFPEKVVLKINGTPGKHLSGTCSPIRHHGNTILGVVIICRDITEKESMQAILAQSQKMDAIGQLAGGVAHDFNNLLTGISGFAELLSIQLENDKQKKESAVRILNAASRAKDLTRKLLSFARKGKMFSSAIDIHEPLQAVLGLLERSIDKKIAIHKSFKARHSTILGDPVQLENILINLGINSADSMENGGTLSFTTTNKQTDTPLYCEFGEVLQPGSYVCIAVKDTGCGIDPESRKVIFEPFYTSKEAGKGTGLGLSAVYGAMKEHGGKIHLFSEVGKGTRFCLYFPVVEDNGNAPLSHENQVLQKGDETILVIDDEPLILSSAKGLLTELGYNILLAEGGQQGIEIYQKYQKKIDIVILDMIMPEMDGASCFKELKKINSNVKVIISSGFAKTARIKDAEKEGAAGFLQKPYTATKVSSSIRNIQSNTM